MEIAYPDRMAPTRQAHASRAVITPWLTGERRHVVSSRHQYDDLAALYLPIALAVFAIVVCGRRAGSTHRPANRP
jgi:hypothetical protein